MQFIFFLNYTTVTFSLNITTGVITKKMKCIKFKSTVRSGDHLRACTSRQRTTGMVTALFEKLEFSE